MKKITLYTGLTLVSLFGLITYFSSCKPNACVNRNVVCNNGGICRDGDCLCASGYEGDSCQFRVNKKFESYYACLRKELINGTTDNDNDDTLRIVALSNNKFGIQFYSIRDSIVNVWNGEVNDNYITIKEQTTDNGFNLYTGTGSLNDGVLVITMNKTYPGGNSSVITYRGYKFE